MYIQVDFRNGALSPEICISTVLLGFNYGVIPDYSCKVIQLQIFELQIFEHLGTTTWIGIHQRWMFIDKVMKGPALTKSRNAVITCKGIASNEDRYL